MQNKINVAEKNRGRKRKINLLMAFFWLTQTSFFRTAEKSICRAKQ
jgi:hypothetical protein